MKTVKKNQRILLANIFLLFAICSCTFGQIINPPIINPNNIDASNLSTNWEPTVNGRYFIQIRHSENNLFMSPSSSRAGSSIIIVKRKELSHANNGTELWMIELAQRGWYYIKHIRTGLYLNAKGRVGTGSELDLQRKNRRDAQKFKFVSTRNGIQVINKSNLRMSLAPNYGNIYDGSKIVFAYSSSTGSLNCRFLEARDYEYQVNIKCTKESDPGSEIELYGYVRVEVHNERASVRVGDIWKKLESNAVDLAEKQTISANPWYFTLPMKWVEAGKYTFKVKPKLYEDDNSSKDDAFTVRLLDPLSQAGTSQSLHCYEGGSVVYVIASLKEFKLL